VFNRVVNAYRKQFPLVTLTMTDLPTLRQIEAIRDRTIDLGFIRPPEGAVPDDIVIATLQHEPLVLVAPLHHPLLDTDAVKIRDLAGYPFVTFLPEAGTGIQPQVLRLCREAGFAPDIALQAGEGSTIIGLVAAGCGISILPESFSAIRVKGVRYRTLADTNAVTQLMLARRKGERSPLADAFFTLAGQLGTPQGNN
jgi:DNA-binding transcriptional LysR family regulator